MFLDGQNTFSAVTTGDAFTAETDNASANYIDQGVSGLAFRGEGGAYVAPWLIAKVTSAAAFGGSGTIQIVLQDAVATSATNATPTGWADIALGPVIAAGAAANALLCLMRIPPTARRFLRVVYRVGTAVVSGGSVLAFLTLDADIVDQALRDTTYAAFVQAGQIKEDAASLVDQ
jgi:hypothetical protein